MCSVEHAPNRTGKRVERLEFIQQAPIAVAWEQIVGHFVSLGSAMYLSASRLVASDWSVDRGSNSISLRGGDRHVCCCGAAIARWDRQRSYGGIERGSGATGAGNRDIRHVGGANLDWAPVWLAVVRPETVIRWHRAGFKAYWRWRSRPRRGRPTVPVEIRQLIREMSLANPLWGAPRIHGELLKLGLIIDRRA